MPPPPRFGKRGVVGAPATQAAFPPPPPRRWRSQTVVIGAISAIALGGMAASEWRKRECEPHRNENADAAKIEGAAPQPPAAVEKRPSWCDSHSRHSSGHGFYSSGGGHGGWFSGGGSSSHASFGGFGAHGSGHGGG